MKPIVELCDAVLRCSLVDDATKERARRLKARCEVRDAIDGLQGLSSF